MRNIIKASLKNSFKNISKNKGLFAVLFITQLAFIIILSVIFTKYAVEISSHAQAVMEPLQDSALVEMDITALYKNPTDIYQEYKQMLSSIFMFFLFVYLCYIVINGINWDISNMILGGKCRCMHYLGTFAILFLIFTLPAVLLINIISKIFFSIELAAAIIILGLAIFLIAIYFMYISFSLINKYKLKDLKKLLKHTFKIGFKNVPVLVTTHIIMLTPQIILLALIYRLLEANFFLLILLIILYIKAINWARIYFLTTVKEITS
jgi:hypothetical protein